MKLKSLINKSVIEESENQYKDLIGDELKYGGTQYFIKSVDSTSKGPVVTTTNGKSFNLKLVLQNGGKLIKKPEKVRAPRTPNPPSTPIISNAKYQSILKHAVKDAGGNEHAYDMAQSMIHDTDIYNRLQKNHPRYNRGMLIRQLAQDMEMYD